jgi:tRNA-Thr(GGU) m(6)t(6)A37 methyltransferase TsaA
MTHSVEPIGILHSPFDEKFGIPRQSGLADHAWGEIRFLPPCDDPAMLDGLEGFSHLWLIFLFSAHLGQGWRSRVRPPRLGGNREVGVWASRSPFRPNPIGLSLVRLETVIRQPRPVLRVAGVDLLDGTPILDIKPYLPYADAITTARAGYANAAPDARLTVCFGAQADAALGSGPGAALRALIVEVLSLDPRPAYRDGAEPARRYGMALAGHEVHWRVLAPDLVEVESVTRVSPSCPPAGGS